MRQIISTCFKIVLPAVLFVLSANAQKLPNIQEKSLRAPANIKVDGKPTEWNNQFQAYNKNTEIFYTISNDNDKLYLTVQVTDLDIMNKIICGGITLTVNSSGKMQDQQGMAITFPVIDLEYEKHLLPGKLRLKSVPPINLDKPADMPVETFIAELNRELGTKSKDIIVSGIKGIKDTVSIYNPEGIKVALLVDNKTSMTYELAVPLKQLGLSVKETDSFTYTIKLSGFNPAVRGELNNALRAQRLETQYSIRKGRSDLYHQIAEGYPPALRILSLASTTDLSGEYTLAK